MKVYLAKSNKANPDNVMRVRQFLKDAQCELVEFSGGTYSNKDLIESDILIVIPETIISSTEAVIGRGLYGQLEDFSITNKIENAFVVTMIMPTMVTMSECVRYEKKDDHSWVNYGSVFFKENPVKLEEVIKPNIQEML